MLLVGSWQFTKVQMLVSLPNDGKPLTGKEMEDIHLDMLRGYLAQQRDAQPCLASLSACTSAELNAFM